MDINVQKLYTLDGHQDCVYGLAGGGRDGTFYSSSGDGMLVQWNLHNPENGRLLAKMKNSVYAIHLIENKKILVAGQNFDGIHLFDIEHNQEVASLKISQTQIFDIKTYENRTFVASADGSLYIVETDRMALIKRIKLADKSVRAIAINDVGGEIAVALSDNTIRILDLDSYRQKYLIQAHKLSVFSIVYHPLGTKLYSASRDAHIKSWDILSGYKLITSVPAHMYAVNSLDISPDQRYLVSGSMDKSIKVWDAGSLDLLKVIDQARFAGHATSVNKVRWSSFNNQILACSDDKNISVWDLRFK